MDPLLETERVPIVEQLIVEPILELPPVYEYGVAIRLIGGDLGKTAAALVSHAIAVLPSGTRFELRNDGTSTMCWYAASSLQDQGLCVP